MKLGGNMNKSFRSTLSAHKLALFIILTSVTAAAGAVLLTPGSGVTAAVVARASFADPTDIKFKVEDGSMQVIHVPDAAQTVVQQITIRSAENNGGVVGTTGWHSHPGPVVVLITAGEMSFYDSDDPTCTVRTYTAGQAFVDSGQGHIHTARNEGSVNLELWATYFDVPVGDAFRNDVTPAPGNCPF
jgi:quercetin dioxygenase-like cupin family protein